MLGWLMFYTFNVLCLLSAWASSVFKRQSVMLKAQWVLLVSCSITTALANLDAAVAFLSHDCTNSHSSSASSFVVAMLVLYIPVSVLFLSLLLAIVSADCIHMRRKRLRKPLLHPRMYKIAHWLVLRILTFTSQQLYILVHIIICVVHWVVEPFLLLKVWHEIEVECRDFRVFSIVCAGLEIVFNILRLMIRERVARELKYEDALLRVDATSVHYMEVTTCNKCGMKFYGTTEPGQSQALGVAGEGRAQFVRHFFEEHGDTIDLEDFNIDERAAIANDKRKDPRIDQWMEDSNSAEKFVEAGKNMGANSRGQEILVHRALGHPTSLTPFQSRQSTIQRQSSG